MKIISYEWLSIQFILSKGPLIMENVKIIFIWFLGVLFIFIYFYKINDPPSPPLGIFIVSCIDMHISYV